MTKQEFDKKRFTGFENILFSMLIDEVTDDDMANCMLIGIDFEQRLIHLRLITSNHYDEEQEFWARCEYCKRPAPKLKAVK